MSRARGLLVMVVAGVGGGGLAVLGARNPWQGDAPADVAGAFQVVSAHASVITTLGAVVLLGTLVVPVVRGNARRVVGAVVALASAGVVYAVLAASGEWVGWRVASLLGGLLGLAAGVLALWRAPRWSAMSTRYDAPGTAEGDRRPAEQDPWKALDRGEDPTL